MKLQQKYDSNSHENGYTDAVTNYGENIILGIVANALTALVATSGRKAMKSLGFDEDKPVSISELLAQASSLTSDTFDWQGQTKIEPVCLFLSSPEVASILRQVFSARVLKKDDGNIDDIELTFVALLTLSLGEPRVDAARSLFRELLAGCDRVLDKAVEDGLLVGHEAKSSLRHRLLMDEIGAVKKNLEFLTDRKTPNLESVNAFEAQYRQLVAQRHADIVPPNFDNAKRIPFDQLYVFPDVKRYISATEASRPIGLPDLAGSIHRSVLLGNPGAGKSTLAQKLIQTLASVHGPLTSHQLRRTPILVVLRDYGAERKENKSSILQFIERDAAAAYQLESTPGVIEYLLRSGRAFVVFDGLDELLDTRHRQDIARDVELFCTLFPSTPVLVTSRQVGYEQAPLDHERFDTLLLDPFTDPQVRKYVENWFLVDAEFTAGDPSKTAETFFNESRIVSDLCGNPLMLALMCNLYRGAGYIPTNRPDVYEKCAVMLFERWDKSRGIKVHTPLEISLRAVLTHLALWMYEGEKLQSGVTEKKLVQKTADYLCPTRFEDRDEAEEAATEFIDFCRGRAWVFTDTGTTKSGEPLFQFTHRTFLEYFTALQLTRLNPTPQKLLEVLAPLIARREWDVVAWLAFQIQNKSVEGAADALLGALTKETGRKVHSESWSILSFATRCLEFIVPSPAVCRALTKRAVEMVAREHRAAANFSVLNNPTEILAALATAARENQRTITETFETIVVERISRSDGNAAALAAEVALHLNLCLASAMSRAGATSPSPFWIGFSDRMRAELLPQLSAVASHDLMTAIDLLLHDKLPFEKLLATFKWRAIFGQQVFRAFANSANGPAYCDLLMGAFSRPSDAPHSATLLASMDTAGKWLLAAPTPWIPPTHVTHLTPPNLSAASKIPRETNFSSNESFALFAFFAVNLELSHRWEPPANIRNQTIASVAKMVQARISARPTDFAVDPELAFNEHQERLVKAWVSKQARFVAKW